MKPWVVVIKTEILERKQIDIHLGIRVGRRMGTRALWANIHTVEGKEKNTAEGRHLV